MANHPVFWAEGDDPEMALATERARSTFRYFWREVEWERRRIVPGLELAAIKAPLTNAGIAGPRAVGPVEHIWIGEPEFDGVALRGILLNEPNQLTSYATGDRIELPRDALEDWIYALEGRAYGAFTVDALRARMPPAERRDHDDAWGFDFGEPGRVEVAPAAYADAEHPMSVNVAPSFREQLRSDPKLLAVSDDEGLTLLHRLALAGSEACVRVALECGADRATRTHAGFTARDLAEALGWPHVVAALEKR